VRQGVQPTREPIRLAAVSAGAFTYAPAGLVQCLVALAVVFLVFNPASSRHYRTSMRNRSSLA
jgi:hypothetical protein